MRRTRPFIALVFLAAVGCGLSHRLRAQTPAAGWTAQVWAAEALGSLNINGLAQTPDGFLWVATPGSIFRFDGSRFIEFPPQTFAGEPGGRVAALCSGPDGVLWIAMDRGRLVRIQGGQAKVSIVGPTDLSADDLIATADGSVWIAYHGGTICHVRDGKVSTLTTQTVSRETSCQLTSDQAGRVWLTQNGEVGLLRDGRFDVLVQLHHAATRIARTSAGGVWICDGVRLYTFAEGKSLTDLGPVVSDTRMAHPKVMREDPTGALWIGTTDAGLLRYTRTTGFEAVPTSFRRINHLLLDNERNVWVGTGGGGLNRINRSQMVIEGAVTGLAAESVQSLCEDDAGTLWAATQGGQLVSRGNAGWIVASGAGAPRTGVTCVAADPRGTVWIGTRQQRLYAMRAGQFTILGSSEGLISRTANALCVSRNGELWLAGTSPSSVQCWRDGKLATLPLPRASLDPSRIIEDLAGQIWIGTAQGQLLRVRGDAVVEESAFVPPGPRRPISSLHVTPDGALWIGYERSGLGRLKDGRYATFHADQGLESDDVRLITDDGQGWLWIASGRGVFKVAESALDAIAVGRATRAQSVRCVAPNGSAALLATRTESGNALRSRDGRLWFPMGAALAVVTPEATLGIKAPSPVRITEIKVDDRAWALDSAAMPVTDRSVRSLAGSHPILELPASHRKLEFEFASLSYTAPENANFRYQLAGFDEGSIDAGTQARAVYPRLPPGHYRFVVNACNSAGIWSDTPAVVAFSVAPLWWQTWWLEALVLIAFTLAVTAAVRAISYRRLHLRVKALEKQTAVERERSRIARDIHDDVGNRLTRILMLSGLAQRGCTEAKTTEHLRNISASAMEVTDSLDEIVWAVNPRNDTLPHLIDYVGRFSVEFLRTAGVRCRILLPEEPPAETVPAEIRHNFFLGLKEALNNVVRHAGATEVKLELTIEGDTVRTVVEDNGHGFEGAPTDATADGLRNMRARMREIGGSCEIDSGAGRGTRVVFVFPWAR